MQLRDSLAAIVRYVMRDTLYLGAYPARVARQWPDGSLDVEVLDARLSGRGLQRVPVRQGLADTTATVQPGTACLVEFDDGDPRKPAVTAWGYSQNSAVVRLAAGQDPRPLARDGDLVAVSVDNSTTITCIVAKPSPTVIAAIAGGALTMPPWDPAVNPVPTIVTIGPDAAGNGINMTGKAVQAVIRATQRKVTA